MTTGSQTFTDTKGNTIEFRLYGSGKHYSICYPGFGESYRSFQNLSEKLTNYTIVAINLYFIGKSQRRAKGFLRNPEWKQTLAEVLEHLRIDHFSVLGYSLGGRFALSTFEAFHDRIIHLLLVAPDGVVKRFTYELATFPIFFRQLFWLFMKFPQPYFLMVGLLARMGLVNSYLANFSKSQMKDSETRMTIYKSWITFKHLRIPQKRLLQLAENGNTECNFIFGEKDKIISPKRHLSFLTKLGKSNIFILPFGHNKLVDNAATEIEQLLR